MKKKKKSIKIENNKDECKMNKRQRMTTCCERNRMKKMKKSANKINV